MIASAAGRTGSALTSVLGPYVRSGATTQDLFVQEVGVFNTTATGLAVGLARQTAAGTAGASITAVTQDGNFVPAGVAFNIGTAAFTVGATIRQASLGAAVGSGVIWTFGGNGLWVLGSTTLGLTIICPTGTGQVVDWYVAWRE